MKTLLKAEQTVAQLSKEDYLLFRNWFYDFDYLQWDKKLELDIKNNKFDNLAAMALEELKQNKAKAL
ncbi:MAG: hypothetical protein EAZ53_08270 [Bacteroidetes bacterium]|nr:MAG: hypothetical protein EAZ53_08270 [Bacteroidota bacterium]